MRIYREQNGDLEKRKEEMEIEENCTGRGREDTDWKVTEKQKIYISAECVVGFAYEM